MASIQARCDELQSPGSYSELKTIISKVSPENPASEILFKGKYQVLYLENLLPWQKPIGQFFQSVLGICYVKPKRFSSSTEESQAESYLSDDGDEGCPLPVVFDFLISPDTCTSSVAVIKHLTEKFDLYPLPQNIGRQLLMLCNYIFEEYKIPYPVVVLCHGRNPKSISIQGAFNNGKMVRVSVNSKGSVKSHEQLPRLSSVKLAHLSGFIPSCAVETSVYARYDVLLCENSSELLPSRHMNVVMECFWSNPSAVLEPVSTDCICYAVKVTTELKWAPVKFSSYLHSKLQLFEESAYKIKAVFGDTDSGASEKFKEVQLVMALRESLQTGVMDWSNSCSGENILQRVEEFMKVETASLLKKQKTVPAITDLEFFDSVVRDNRSNLDFADKLWLILKDCSSCEELKEAFFYVFDKLSELVDPPFVYQEKASTIAQSVRNMRERAVTCPPLTSHLASQMLLEIGIEKLRRDYVDIFVGLELAPYDSINYFLQPEIASVESVICLQKLHSVLELTIIGLKCLCLSKLLLSEFIRNVLKYYATVPHIDLEHIFKFQIPSAKARYLLDQLRPTIWEISLLSSEKDYRKQTVLHYSTTPTSDHVYAPKGYHPKLMLKNASYVFLTGTLIEDTFFGS